MSRKILCCVFLSWSVFFLAGACFGMGGGNTGGGVDRLSSRPLLVIVHKTPFSEEFGEVLKSLSDSYKIRYRDVDYSEYFALSEEERSLYEAYRQNPSLVWQEGSDVARFVAERLTDSSIYWEDYREYLLDSGPVLIFTNRAWSRIGIRVGELTQEEIIDFFTRRGEPLEMIGSWEDRNKF